MVILNEHFLENSPSGVKNREVIEILFEFKEAIAGMSSPYSNFKEMHQDLHELDFSIQEAFGFPQNKDFHRFWEYPGCSCPYIDNFDTWGTSSHYYNENCPVHGKEDR